jgi:hypothetical protein
LDGRASHSGLACGHRGKLREVQIAINLATEKAEAEGLSFSRYLENLKIFLEVAFETSLARALQRDRYLFGDREEILQRYHQRYIPGQQLYLEAVKPHLKADMVIDNNEFEKPEILFQRI